MNLPVRISLLHLTTTTELRLTQYAFMIYLYLKFIFQKVNRDPVLPSIVLHSSS